MMMHNLFSRIFAAVSIMIAVASTAAAAEPDRDDLRRRFEQYSGARLVFDRGELPTGKYYDVLKPLDESMQSEAATICLREASKYPPGYFAEVGLKVVGVFAACVSHKGDGFRAYDHRLQGYPYFGVYNGVDAVVAAHYDDPQLEMTFHHEIFHHVDSTHLGTTESWQLSSDDAVYKAAISGMVPHRAANVSAEDLAALRANARGFTLHDTVSPYAARNSREDQAETARHLMRNLPDSLLQAIERPELPGSQRILHILAEYEQAVPDGPGFDWFLDVALDRKPKALAPLLARLQAYADGSADDPVVVRKTLQAIGRLDTTEIPPNRAAEVVPLASLVTEKLLKERIRPDTAQEEFSVWGPEDAAGVNWTLRNDVTQFATDAVRLKRIAAFDKRQSDLLARTQMKNLRLVARYYDFIAANWSVTPGTLQVFESACQTLSASLPTTEITLTKTLQSMELAELAVRISKDGQPQLLPAPVSLEK